MPKSKMSWVLPIVFGTYVFVTTYVAHHYGREAGLAQVTAAVTRARREERAEARRLVQREHEACAARVEQARDAADQICDAEREAWGSNLEALRADMQHYEEDLERCYHVRAR